MLVGTSGQLPGNERVISEGTFFVCLLLANCINRENKNGQADMVKML